MCTQYVVERNNFNNNNNKMFYRVKQKAIEK